MKFVKILEPKVETPKLDELIRLEAAAERFEEENSNVIEKEREAHQKEKIRLNILRIEEVGFEVWCRNGSVCDNTTPCRDLNCKFKKSKDDVAVGAAKCRQFEMFIQGIPLSYPRYDSHLDLTKTFEH